MTLCGIVYEETIFGGDHRSGPHTHIELDELIIDTRVTKR